MREWSRNLKVSINTLRAALVVLEKEGLLTVRHGSRMEATQATRPPRIGVFSELDVLDRRLSVYHADLPRALRSSLRELGALPRLYVGTGGILDARDDTADWDLIGDLESSRLDGLAMSGFLREPLSRLLAEKPIPVVGDNHSFPFGVEVDWSGLLREGCRRLHTHGCHRIAVMGWIAPGILDLLPSILSDLGLEYRPRWIKHDFEPNLTGAAWALVREIWTAYPEKPDGLVVCDDVLFATAVPAILELRIRVPAQLRVVAHANKGARPAAPFPVTFAEVDPGDMARRMAAMLLHLVRREPLETAHEFSPVHWQEDGTVSVPGSPSDRSPAAIAR